MPFGRYIREGHRRSPPQARWHGRSPSGRRQAAGGRRQAAGGRRQAAGGERHRSELPADGVSRGTWDAHIGSFPSTPRPTSVRPLKASCRPRPSLGGVQSTPLSKTQPLLEPPFRNTFLSTATTCVRLPTEVRPMCAICVSQTPRRRSCTRLAVTGPHPQPFGRRRPGRPAVHSCDQPGRPPSCGHRGHSGAHPGHRLRTWPGHLAASPTPSDRPTDQSRPRLHGAPAQTRVARRGVVFGAGRLNRSRMIQPQMHCRHPPSLSDARRPVAPRGDSSTRKSVTRQRSDRTPAPDRGSNGLHGHSGRQST
jgi:hypothetical protein